MVMKETRYCEKCDKETVHEVEVERDAEHPPASCIEARDEGYASMDDCIFYANGDSDYRVTCSVCWCRYTDG